VVFFAWSAALGKILTKDSLRNLYIIVVEWCCLHKMNGESIDHLLLHSEITGALWSRACLGYAKECGRSLCLLENAKG
jgi:hypothetical protein